MASRLSQGAVAYLRASTCRQELGPEAQRASIERWAAREGVTIIAWHSDLGRSGALPVERRPGLAAAVSQVERGEAGLLVVDVRDRLSRRVLQSLTLEARLLGSGGRVVSACGTANGDSEVEVALRQLQYVFAELERNQMRRRVKGAMSIKRKRNEKTGQPPYGFEADKDNQLIINPYEQQVIWAIASLRRRGFGYIAIRRELTRWGYLSRTGQPMHDRSIVNVCHRLRIVAQGRNRSIPVEHVLLERDIVWDCYARALREAHRIHPSQHAPKPAQRLPRTEGPGQAWQSWSRDDSPPK